MNKKNMGGRCAPNWPQLTFIIFKRIAFVIPNENVFWIEA